MKKIILTLITTFILSACSQSKHVYFNGSEGSNSGIKYQSTDKTFSIN